MMHRIQIKINKASMEMNTSEQFMYKRITIGTFVVNQDRKKYLVQTNEKKNYLDFCKFNKCDNNVAYI